MHLPFKNIEALNLPSICARKGILSSEAPSQPKVVVYHTIWSSGIKFHVVTGVQPLVDLDGKGKNVFLFHEADQKNNDSLNVKTILENISALPPKKQKPLVEAVQKMIEAAF